jgi:hypothetical protein
MNHGMAQYVDRFPYRISSISFSIVSTAFQLRLAMANVIVRDEIKSRFLHHLPVRTRYGYGPGNHGTDEKAASLAEFSKGT